MRGKITWQGSVDGYTWQNLDMTMADDNLKTNLVSISAEALVLHPNTPAYYRCMLQEGTCDPLFSDSIKVNPLGELLYDETVNVAAEALTVAVDSIEVTLPAGLSDEDFRMTIIKITDPPSTPEGYNMGTVYDVSLSLGSVFEYPLTISGALGHIGAGGYVTGYFSLNTQFAFNPVVLKQTMAHEYMHYAQSKYMPVVTANYFFAEAHAPLADRIVWNETTHKSPEPLTHLKDALTASDGVRTIYDLLGQSWDAGTSFSLLEKFTSDTAEANTAGSITQHTHAIDKWGAYYSSISNSDFGEHTHTVTYETHTLDLKEVRDFSLYDDDNLVGEALEFKTSSTNETKAILKKMEHNVQYTKYDPLGEVTASGSASYVSTDFSGVVTVLLWLHFQ